jgi:hypothetical protein
MSSYESKIAEFRSRITDIGKQLVELGARRKSFALTAASGDAKAKQAISEIDFLLDAARKEEATIGSAVETAIALERQEAHEAEAKAKHEREVKAYALARAIVTINCELDEAMIRLREAFERRASLLIELGNSDACDRQLIMRLSHKSGPTAAAQQAGLAKFLNVEMTPNAAVRPLSDTNSVLLGIGAAPDDKSADKPSLRPRVTARH